MYLFFFLVVDFNELKHQRLQTERVRSSVGDLFNWAGLTTWQFNILIGYLRKKNISGKKKQNCKMQFSLFLKKNLQKLISLPFLCISCHKWSMWFEGLSTLTWTLCSCLSRHILSLRLPNPNGFRCQPFHLRTPPAHIDTRWRPTLTRFLLEKQARDKARAPPWSPNPSTSPETSVFNRGNPTVSALLQSIRA